MLGHEAFGVGGTLFGDGGEDLAVFRYVVVQPVGVGGAPGEEPTSHLDQPERGEHTRQLFVARGARERDVEVAAGVMRDDAVARLFFAFDGLFESLEIFFRPSLGREACDPGLDDRAHLHAAEHRVQPKVRHPETPVGVEVHEAFASQPPQGLAYGGA